MRISLGLAACLLQAALLSAQDSASTARVGVYLDCQTTYCDFDFFRTELTLVNWVRDRQVADVHLLVTTQATGAGGSEYTINKVFSDDFAFEIPHYQRPYSWTIEHASELLSDLLATLGNGDDLMEALHAR